jgi:FKBP-type peptidyl-prolyl cis-trans isomerase
MNGPIVKNANRGNSTIPQRSGPGERTTLVGAASPSGPSPDSRRGRFLGPLLGSLLLLSFTGVVACAPAVVPRRTQTPPELDSLEDRFSYAVGVKLGRDLAGGKKEVDPDLMRRGLDDALAGESTMDEAQVDATLEEYGQRRIEILEQERAKLAEAMRGKSRRFLDQNRDREGVVELSSGLQYEVLQAGDGPSPTANDFVTCHYRALLPDGSVFDDTFAQGEPRTFNVASVVDGLEQGLQMMQPGARWKLYLPPELAYGESGMGREIPPYAVLVFEIELITIDGETPPAQG